MHGTGEPLGPYSDQVPADAEAAARAVALVLARAQRILVLGHTGADGDVAGSSLALALALREQGKDAVVYNEVPYTLAFPWLPGADTVVQTLASDDRFDVTIVVDAADPARCGAHFPAADARGAYIWVDHHRIATPPGDVNYIDLTAAAVGEQVAAILDAMAHPISTQVATCIYTSLMSDTGGFRYSNTSARAFRLAARLVSAGVEPWEIAQRLYESQPEARVRLLGRALNSLWRSPDGAVGMIQLTQHDLDVSGADESHLPGLVNHVRAIEGVEMAILLRECARGTEVVLRATGRASAADLAERLGHAGNSRAARFILPSEDGHVATWVRAAAVASMTAGIPPMEAALVPQRRSRRVRPATAGAESTPPAA